jgi:[ribosomal protein S18]-alanine N-acetyltransferase
MLEIIHGDARDIAGVMTVMNDAFDPQFGEAWTAAQCLALLTLPHNQLLLAKLCDVTVGFAMTRWVLDEEELLMIAVARTQQRQNIGGQLLQSVRNGARNGGRKKLFLEVRDNNNAHKFYLRQGFEEVGRRKGYYRGNSGQSFDAITMSAVIS